MICLWSFTVLVALLVLSGIVRMFSEGLHIAEALVVLFFAFLLCLLLGQLTGTMDVHIFNKLFTIIK